MKARVTMTALFIFCLFLFAVSASAQPVGWSVSEPRPLSELDLPYVSDTYFFANYSPNTAVIYVNGKATDVTVPPFSFRWASFYVARNTKIEAKTNVVTDKGTKVQNMKRRKATTRDGRHYGWLFEMK